MNNGLKNILTASAVVLAGGIGWYIGQNSHKPADYKINDNVMAIINNQIISKQTFLEQMKLRGGLRPGQYQDLKQKETLLDFLISQEVMFSQAKEKGILEDSVVQGLFKKVVIDRFLELELKPKLASAKVTKFEINKYFNENKQSYSKPARRRAAIIYININKKDNDEIVKEKRLLIQEALSKVADLPEGTLHFGELAKTYSNDRNSRYQGGVIGWLINHPSRKYRWDDKVVEALFALKNNGDISPIIKTSKGFYVVRLVSAENIKEKSLSKLEKGIKNNLLQKKKKEIKNNFIEEITQLADISINQDLLASIEPLSKPVKNKTKKPPALPGSGGN